MLGGKGDYESTLAAYLYVISPLYLFILILSLTSMGLVMGWDPALAASLRNLNSGMNQDQVAAFARQAPAAAIGVSVVLLAAFLAPFVWFGICWSAFRRIHRLSAARSGVAYVLVMLLLLGFARVWGFMMTAVHGHEFLRSFERDSAAMLTRMKAAGPDFYRSWPTCQGCKFALP